MKTQETTRENSAGRPNADQARQTPAPERLKFHDEATDFHNGQTDCTLYLYNDAINTGPVIGYIHYTIYHDRVFINMIHVHEQHRRKGHGRALMAELERLNHASEIIPGNVTDEGAAFFKVLTIKYN